MVAAFNLFDLNGNGRLNRDEATCLLHALDVVPGAPAPPPGSHPITQRHAAAMASTDAVTDIMRRCCADPAAGLTLEEVCEMMRRQTHCRSQVGRQFVALSLQEAEGLRGIMHLSQGASLTGAGSAVVGLRFQLGGAGMLLDASNG